MDTPVRACRASRAAGRGTTRLAVLSFIAGWSGTACAQSAPPETLDRVTVTGSRPSSLPLELPTTVESITREQIDDAVNATDAEDALKYLPSLTVRKRYIGDYDHAVLGSRASGTGNSARSLVYADGMLLSNLLGNGATFTPRWGLVAPEEIERVDVLYGPFSAAYPGNSVGAVVDFVTRMPTGTEAHAKVGGFIQHAHTYASDGRYGGGDGSVALGSRDGPFAWWIDANRIDSEGQPISFANRLVSAGVPGNAGVPVTGAVFDQNPKDQNWWILGSTTQTHTTQDEAKVKLSYDLAPNVKATYVFGAWDNDSTRSASTYLRDANGSPVYAGTVNIAGRSYALTASDLAPTRARLSHLSQGLTLQSSTRSSFDFALSASDYRYDRDLLRTPTVPVASASSAGAGTLTDMKGSGWTTLAARGTWRPDPSSDVHVVEAGLQRDAFRLRTRVNATDDWIAGQSTGPVSRFEGDTALTSFWAQDAWRFAPDWKAIVGVRGERWTAHDGLLANATTVQRFGARQQDDLSPKGALGYTGIAGWELRTSIGRALRFPTVSELYQGSLVNGVVTNNDPDLRPERSWTGEASAEYTRGADALRFTYFHERTHDALYSQTDVTIVPNVTNIQNVDLIRTNGFEVSAHAANLFASGIDTLASITYADSRTLADRRFPASVGQRQPRVPEWRANLLATWHATDALTATLGGRYSGRQFGTLDNSDPNGATYTGFSSYLVVDTRLRYRFDRHWTGSIGVDNLNDRKYWAFHPYPRRTWLAELGVDL